METVESNNNHENLNNDEESRECRVCRCNSEDGRPLYTPCLCSGSIGLVHQDCLEAWLLHSKKVLQLCGIFFLFLMLYKLRKHVNCVRLNMCSFLTMRKTLQPLYQYFSS